MPEIPSKDFEFQVEAQDIITKVHTTRPFDELLLYVMNALQRAYIAGARHGLMEGKKIYDSHIDDLRTTFSKRKTPEGDDRS